MRFQFKAGNVYYISRGLFNLIGEDEDYALEFVIGHEISAVDLGHAIEVCLRMKRDEGITPGNRLQALCAADLCGRSGTLATDKINQEFAADEWVCNKMMQSERTRREILVFLQKLEGYSKDHGFYSGRMPPQLRRHLSPVDNHYRAQIAARERLKHLKELIAQSVTAQKETPPPSP